MKRIRCPKCDEPILFDEKQYEPGRILVFECPDCHKQFRIRIPQPAVAPAPSEESEALGSVVVLENAFQLKQEIHLYEGDNVLGRSVKGTSANAAITTVDPSIDTTHCIIHVRLGRDGRPVFTLRDAPSNTGTFLHGDLLGDRDRVRIEDGAIINIGAATLILRTQSDEATS